MGGVGEGEDGGGELVDREMEILIALRLMIIILGSAIRFLHTAIWLATQTGLAIPVIRI